MTTPSPYGQPANPDPYGTGYNQPVYPGAGQPYAQPANPGPYNQLVHPAAVQPYVPVAYVQPYAPVAVGPYVVPKSKAAAALLAFFLGTIGAHNFYRGQVGRGFGHIALVVVAIICAITAAVMAADAAANLPVYASPPDLSGAYILVWLVNAANGIWTFIEFIMILASNDGSLR